MDSERFTFFWRGTFSQWHRSPFELDGESFCTAEQFMMASKARLFGDEATRAKIMQASDPRQQKALGRQVKNFDESRWNESARRIVYIGNRAKFTQDPALFEALIATRGTTLVEASPYDTVWGIGLTATDPRAQRRTTWRGYNWLGEVLTVLRDRIS